MKKFNELLKKAYEKGIVKSVEDAFNEFAPYQQDYFVAEQAEIYGGKCKVGDIVYVKKYRYDDGRVGRNHMFVIIGQNDTLENFGMLISSDLEKLKYKENMLLEKNNINNLSKDSIVKTDVIYKLLDKNIVFKIGEVEKEKVEEYYRFFESFMN